MDADFFYNFTQHFVGMNQPGVAGRLIDNQLFDRCKLLSFATELPEKIFAVFARKYFALQFGGDIPHLTGNSGPTLVIIFGKVIFDVCR